MSIVDIIIALTVVIIAIIFIYILDRSCMKDKKKQEKVKEAKVKKTRETKVWIKEKERVKRAIEENSERSKKIRERDKKEKIKRVEIENQCCEEIYKEQMTIGPLDFTITIVSPTLTISNADSMKGIEFEYFIAKLLRSREFINVKVTQGSGDFGVDIIAEKQNDRYAIQVKRYSKIVSRRAVSDAVAGKDYYNCNKAMVITNSHLSIKSKEFAQKVGCIIIEREELAKWILNFQ